MKLPKQVTILGQKYSIVQQNELKSESKDVWGSVDLVKKTIYLDKSQTDIEKISTLIHEMGHAVFFESAINLTTIHHDVEEILVEQIAKTITNNLFKKKKASPKARKTKPSETTLTNENKE